MKKLLFLLLAVCLTLPAMAADVSLTPEQLAAMGKWYGDTTLNSATVVGEGCEYSLTPKGPAGWGEDIYLISWSGGPFQVGDVWKQQLVCPADNPYSIGVKLSIYPSDGTGKLKPDGTYDDKYDINVTVNAGEAKVIELAIPEPIMWHSIAMETTFWTGSDPIQAGETDPYKVIVYPPGDLTPRENPRNLTPNNVDIDKDTYLPNQLVWSPPIWGPSFDPNFVSFDYDVDYYSKPTDDVAADDPNFANPLNNIQSVNTGDANSLALAFEYETAYFWRVTANTTWDANDITGNWVDSGTEMAQFTVKPENVPPVADAGQSIVTWLDKANQVPGTVALAGSVDEGGETGTITNWTAYTAEFGGTVPTDKVIFTDSSSLTTPVTITEVGEYILQLTADDGVNPISIDQMKITVYADACTAAKMNPNGYTKHPYDFSDNCVVDLPDLAIFAAEWLKSTVLTSDAYFTATVGDPVPALVVEYWTNVAGTEPNVILTDPRYPDNPTGKGFVTGGFTQPDRGLSDFSQRIRGYIVPPTTGSYTLYIASDDHSDLMLSTDTDPANAVKIAEVNGYTGISEWTKFPEQTSAAVSLTAGTYYYVEVLHKEQGGGDFVSVAWSTDGGTTKTVIPASALRWYLP